MSAAIKSVEGPLSRASGTKTAAWPLGDCVLPATQRKFSGLYFTIVLNAGQHDPNVMLVGMGVTKCANRAGFWRRLTSITISYALIIQTIFVGLAGAQLAANTVDAGVPSFELCLNGGHNAPMSPADAPLHDGDHHCALCFAGAFQVLAPPLESSRPRVEIGSGVAWWPAPGWLPPQAHKFAIARPRGPPLSA